ncbi:TM2 domain-containing protein [Haloplasma contractile]|uniref:TM2 domain family protein n=1 Tax=Haloplasma contractile SSD-17B TaxID=1033810 RepID=U2EDW5_9MOLU|nr:NINE protein [Haloplasma contractile]ERJ13183.1 TM2 domain family protein [Haloplasma contractile SSD-17B]
MYCSKCGKEIDNDAVVCVHCGVPTNNAKQVNTDPHAKSKIAAGLLGILIGGLGIHNFYLGYTGKGIAQLLLTVVGWIIIIGPLVAYVWGLVEGIQILTGSIDRDADGRLLKE